MAIDRSRFDAAQIAQNPFWCPDPVAAGEWAALSGRSAPVAQFGRRGDRGGGNRRAARPWRAALRQAGFSDLASAMMSINAVKGVEIGDGMATAAADRCGQCG
jgi:chorismate synthase